MKRIFAAMVAVVLAAGLTPVSAAGTHGGGMHGGGMNGGGVHGIRGLRAEPMQRVPNMQSRIPAPLAEPAQPPVINGPLAPNGMLPPMGNGL
jgi:hypothetical protein